MRIQFELEGEIEQRFAAQLYSDRERHDIARRALVEWITRQETRSKRARQELLDRDADYFAAVMQRAIDSGKVVIR